MTKPTNAALSERRNHLRKRSLRETSHLLQNKDGEVLDDEGMVLCDFVPVNNNFLNSDGVFSTQKNSVPFPQVQQESVRGILLNRKVYQRLQQGRE